MVSNLAYTRWKDAYPIIRAEIDSIHDNFHNDVNMVDQQMLALYEQGQLEEMKNLATEFSVRSGDELHKHWWNMYGKLFARFRDFYVVEEDLSNTACNCKVGEEDFSDSWKERIISETGDRYLCENESNLPEFLKTNGLLRGSNSQFL
jgi:hypothetical protein